MKTLASLLSLSLLTASGLSAQDLFRANLDGAQENPPVVTTASGWATVVINTNNTVTYDVRTCGVTATAAHIHDGDRGTNGPVVVALTGGPTQWSGTSGVLTAAQLDDLRAGGYYINVHSAANPTGEIRGQIEPSPNHFSGILSGDQEVPPVVTGASGTATVQVNADRSLTYNVVTSGVTGTAAHIHIGAFGTNGGVVVGLTGGPSVWSGTSAPISTADYMVLQEKGLYVNVHSAANPGGEIRSQLIGTNEIYGTSCQGGATLTTAGAPLIGERIDIIVAGGKPGGTGEIRASFGPDASTINDCCDLLERPLVKQVTIPLDSAGGRTINKKLPNSITNRKVYLQFLGFDNQAPNGFYMTNGVMIDATKF